ncbi:MAG: hypothetical protein M3Q69_02020 [Acidobacteriota bacterium]|nr:hypothetical protein [Acidobacteriota bacterium]
MLTSRGSSTVLPYLLIVLAGLFLMWVRAFRLTYSDTGLQYRTLFGGTRKILIADVSFAEIELGVHGYSDRFLPTARLVIHHRDASEKPLVVNLKVFSRGCVDGLLSVFTNASLLREP